MWERWQKGESLQQIAQSIREARCRAHWRAIDADIALSRSNAVAYMTEKVPAPAYRLPAYAFASAVVELMKDGDLGDDEYRPLLEYFRKLKRSSVVLMAFKRRTTETPSLRWAQKQGGRGSNVNRW
jgi:hypothetical protein